MFAIIVTEKAGDQRRLEFDKSEITIGRVQGNDVILPKGNVSKRHARIVLKDDKFIIVDLKSTNGTYVNGRKISSPLVLKEADKIYVGDFILGVQGSAAAEVGLPEEPPAAPRVPPPAPVPDPLESRREPPLPHSAPPPRAAPFPPPRREPPLPTPRTSASQPLVSPVAAAESAPLPETPLAPPVPSTRLPSPSSKRLVGAGARSPSSPSAAALSLGRPPRSDSVAPLDPQIVKMLELQHAIVVKVTGRLGLGSVAPERLGDEDLRRRTESAIAELLDTFQASGELPSDMDRGALLRDSLNEALGLGPLEDLLDDEGVEEIIVDRRDRILIGRGGQMAGSGRGFSSDESLRRIVERLAAPTGHSVDERTPLIDIRLRDGSRLAAAVPPVSVRGACLTLRKPRRGSYSLSELTSRGTLSPPMAQFLTTCIAARKNILVCGAPGSGKSAMLAALAAAAPEGERVVTVEDVAELSLERDGWIALEARPSDSNGVPEVDLQSLLRGALRMRPDRLVVGCVHGVEALELVSAMVSSADGTLAAIAGDGAEAALARLTALARLGAPGATTDALRELVAMAIDIVVHVARYADGVFRVASIVEVGGGTVSGFESQELFAFRGSTKEGGFVPAGVIPAFYAELEVRGIPADTTIFRT